MSVVEKIEIENKDNKDTYNINKVDINNNTFNKETFFKLDFNFDLLNEPMPDFSNQQKIINKKNGIYKRKYNEINNNDYSYLNRPTLKIK